MLMIAALAHKAAADWALTGALILFAVVIVAALVWAEIDRRRTVVGGRAGVQRLVAPFSSRRERW